jgi:hypothetical protein
MVNLFSGNMFSFDFRKTSAWDYQRRLLRPWPTSPLRSMWAANTVLLGHRSIRCGPRLRHVGHDYGETKNAAHIRTESRPTSHRNLWPTSNGITGPHRPEYAPAVPGREPYTRVDAFLPEKSGAIYGGTSDGYLFRLNPENLTVTNLGKPLNQYRIAGLAWGANGKIYGVGGDELEMARLFSYDPADGSYELPGFIDVNRRPYFAWQAYVIGDIVSDARGTVFLGENERISKLYLFFP